MPNSKKSAALVPGTNLATFSHATANPILSDLPPTVVYQLFYEHVVIGKPSDLKHTQSVQVEILEDMASIYNFLAFYNLTDKKISHCLGTLYFIGQTLKNLVKSDGNIFEFSDYINYVLLNNRDAASLNVEVLESMSYILQKYISIENNQEDPRFENLRYFLRFSNFIASCTYVG